MEVIVVFANICKLPFLFSIYSFIAFQRCTAYYSVFLVEIKTNIYSTRLKAKKKALKRASAILLLRLVINNVMHKLYHLSLSLSLAHCLFLFTMNLSILNID